MKTSNTLMKRQPTIKFCPACGVGVMPGDGGVGVAGKTYCSEECAAEDDRDV